jgi:hypothetical protein
LRRLGRKRAADEPFRCSGDFQASVAGDARGVNDFGLPGEPLRRAPSPAYRTEGPFAPWHFSEDASLGRFRPHLAATNRTASTAGWPGLYLSCERRLAIGHVEVSTLDREPRDWHQYSSGVLGEHADLFRSLLPDIGDSLRPGWAQSEARSAPCRCSFKHQTCLAMDRGLTRQRTFRAGVMGEVTGRGARARQQGSVTAQRLLLRVSDQDGYRSRSCHWPLQPTQRKL